MKKLMKTIMVVGVFAIFAFAPVNVKETACVAENVEVACMVEEAIHCKVYSSDGQLTASCWFCDCDELALYML